ncbi:hypothetical protein DENIT_13028 [Pseudomonas veronii]|nr:hypothetical protein DENIT_13028 [Pseudomonas veronii]
MPDRSHDHSEAVNGSGKFLDAFFKAPNWLKIKCPIEHFRFLDQAHLKVGATTQRSQQ